MKTMQRIPIHGLSGELMTEVIIDRRRKFRDLKKLLSREMGVERCRLNLMVMNTTILLENDQRIGEVLSWHGEGSALTLVIRKHWKDEEDSDEPPPLQTDSEKDDEWSAGSSDSEVEPFTQKQSVGGQRIEEGMQQRPVIAVEVKAPARHEKLARILEKDSKQAEMCTSQLGEKEESLQDKVSNPPLSEDSNSDEELKKEEVSQQKRIVEERCEELSMEEEVGVTPPDLAKQMEQANGFYCQREENYEKV